MNNELTVAKRPGGSIVSNGSTCFTFALQDPREFPDERGGEVESFVWGQSYAVLDDIELIPYGVRNNMPQLLRDTIYQNPDIPGTMEKKQQLLWGQGPLLYKEIIADGKPAREWTYDQSIQDWLDSFEYKEYLFKILVDHSFMQGSFTEVINAKSGRLGKTRIHSLEQRNPLWTRLGRKINSEKETHAFCSDSRLAYSPIGYQVYPLFDPKNPDKAGRTVYYSRQYTFATDFYAIPTILGTLPWIRRSTATPLILEALSKFSMNAKYHVSSPAAFWEAKRQELQADCLARNEPYTESMLDDYEAELFRSIIKTLSGEGNAGKIWHTKNIYAPDGSNLTELGWKIEPIDQNIKEFVDTQIAISNKATASVVSNTGMHKALAGISAPGTADSGSEQLYAYLLYKLTGVRIPEQFVTNAINHAIRINFPEKNLKLGFFHEEAQRQEDTTSKDRVNNNPQ